MKIEEAIETLEEKRKYCKMFYELSANPQEDYPSTAKFMDALELALTVLRSMQEAGEPLSLEQLKQMDGKPVWIVEFPDWGHWELSEDAEDYLCDRDTDLYGFMSDLDGEAGYHELGWLAYPYPPAHIDRSEWTAEWIYPENEWNLPRCSKCGCNSKDATYGHKSNFCPKCGRAMTPEAWAELERRLKG